MTVSPGEAAESAGYLTFAVAVDRAVCQPVAVVFRNPAGGTASAGSDYLWREYRIELSGAATESSLAVELVDDKVDEVDETVHVEAWVTVVTPRETLSWQNPVVEGTIIDDDVAALSVFGATADEGSVLSFVVRLDRPSSREVTVRYATEAGGSDPAEAGTDYLAADATATIPAGELSAPARGVDPRGRPRRAR